jgi:flagellar basal-body rod protein FlgB
MANSFDVIRLLEAGIKAEGIRQRTIASNIANNETPGYRRLDVKFEQLLSKAIDSSDPKEAAKIEPEVFQPLTTPLRSNGNDVNLEAEIGEMLKNSLRHAAYTRLLRRKFAQMETAIGVQG